MKGMAIDQWTQRSDLRKRRIVSGSFRRAVLDPAPNLSASGCRKQPERDRDNGSG
jgi:hypothetical protein